MLEPFRRTASIPSIILGTIALAFVAACSDGRASTAPSVASTPAASAAAATATALPAGSTAPSAAATVPPTPTPSDGSTVGQVRTDAFGIDQIWVPAGSFTMGTSETDIAKLRARTPPDWVTPALDAEAPAHKVTLTKGYWIDKTEVTNTAFKAFVDAGGYTTQAYWSDDGWAWLATKDASRLPLHCQGDVADHPRMCLTWYEAQAYAAWRGGRLPTEAEWEYAARGSKSSVYPWGDAWANENANVINSVGPKPVGSYPSGASWVGALDLAGNAMEWVADWRSAEYYASSPATDPPGPATGTIKVEKGGWWGSNEFVARSAYRHFEDPPTYGDKHIGFRVASQ
jgi:formylglycine-generating enzyme required for sulfatase activity